MKTLKFGVTALTITIVFLFSGHTQTSIRIPEGNAVSAEYSNLVGIGSGENNTSSGNFNNFFGYRSGNKNSDGMCNNFIGFYSGFRNQSGNYNTYMGHRSGYQNDSGSYNTFIGAYSGCNNNGIKNVFIGNSAGYKTSGNQNIFIGYYAGYDAEGDNKLYIENSKNNNPLVYGDFDKDYLQVNGNFYTTGKIWSTEITVELTNPYADFVFNKGYNLRSLAEVEKYIQKHHHLPDVPCEAEVKESGIKLGEMNTILLQKIEELTLYIIQMEKEYIKLKEEVDQLQSDL